MTTRLNMPKRPSTPIINENPVPKANAATDEIRKPRKIVSTPANFCDLLTNNLSTD